MNLESLSRDALRTPSLFGKQFLHFLTKRNVIALSIAVVMANAVNAIVTSIVTNIINPIVGLAGANNLEFLFISLKGANGRSFATPSEANANGVVTLNYGAVLSSLIDFAMIALFCFFITKVVIEKLMNHKSEYCQYCQEDVLSGATRCPHCSSSYPIAGLDGHQTDSHFDSKEKFKESINLL